MKKYLLSLCVFSMNTTAGVYGDENWGEMYWGDNPATAPITAPTIASAVATEDQIIITLGEYPVGTGADGWSSVTSYTVTCGEASVSTVESSVTITGLDSGTTYSCSIVANNAKGDSPELIRVVATGDLIRGMNFTIICASMDCRART